MRLLLAIQDVQYAVMLMRSIRQSEWKDKLTVSMRSASLEAQDDPLGEYDVLLVDRQMHRKMENQLSAECAVLLSEQHAHDEEVLPSVYKYQSVSGLLSEVLQHYERHNGTTARRSADGGKHTRFIGVYSASGGAGTTRIAVGLAELLAAAGNRVFYLNMESMPSRLSAQMREEPRFCRILYQLKSGEGDGIRTLWFRDSERGFDTFPIPEHEAEWAEFSGQDIRELLARIAQLGEYDCVITDLDSYVSERVVAAIAACTDVLWLIRDDVNGRFKSEFAERAIHAQLPDHLDRVRHTVTVSAPDEASAASACLPYLKLLGMEVKRSDA